MPPSAMSRRADSVFETSIWQSTAGSVPCRRGSKRSGIWVTRTVVNIDLSCAGITMIISKVQPDA